MRSLFLFLYLLCLSGAVYGQYRGAFLECDFATTVFDASGINGVPGFNVDPTRVLGFPPSNATPAVPDNSKLFSFGWGGYVTVGFDRPVWNIPAGADPTNPFGYDLIVFGNAFYIGGNSCLVYAEPGYVEVGLDVNGNGVPDSGDDWYLLLPRLPDPRDGNGIPRFPLVDSFFGGVQVCGNPFVGYADATPLSNQGHLLIPDDPYTPGLQNGSAGGDAFDLDWAVDWETGEPIPLQHADFVRIAHAGNANLGAFGRSSTEVSAVALMRLPGDTDGDGCVNDEDLLRVLFAFGTQDLPADVNRDGLVDDGDLLLVLFHFGLGCELQV
jgi:hypothetical protein